MGLESEAVNVASPAAKRGPKRGKKSAVEEQGGERVEDTTVPTAGAKSGTKRGKKSVADEQGEARVEDANVASAGTKRGSKRKSAAVEEQKDGKEEVAKKPSRPAEVDPAEEQMIRDKIAAMPTIEEARRWEFPRMMTGFINFMRRLGFLSEVSIGIYLMNVRKLYYRDCKPPEVMVSDEYRQLVRNSREDKMCSHQFSSALTKFTAFYEERAKAGRGRFTLDPVWEDEKATKAAENKWKIDHPKPGELMSRWFQPQARPAAKPAEAAPKPQKKIDYTEVCGWVSIKDPTSQARIETPVRGKNCDHIGVFDKESYVEYNAMLSKKEFHKLSNMWNCPLCNKPAPEATLEMDIVFAEALEIVRDRPEIEHLILQPDGRLCIPETTSIPGSNCADDEESTSMPQKEESVSTPENACADEEARTSTPQKEESVSTPENACAGEEGRISTPQKEESVSTPESACADKEERTSTPRKESASTPQRACADEEERTSTPQKESTSTPQKTCADAEESTSTLQKACADAEESTSTLQKACPDEEGSALTPQKAPIAPSSPRSEPKQPSASRETGSAGGSGNNKDAELADMVKQGNKDAELVDVVQQELRA